MTEERHTPVNGFNAREASEVLRRAFQDATAAEQRAQTYKPPSEAATTGKATGPWANKPNNMTGGQDFFVQFRKTVASLQQSGGVGHL
ncbi:MAG: hypothetical protein M1833_004424 [Piccolia ochrophora]|nr:MAG: hypothetical protein M1833_004424 [Piccolia ochrophora]